MANYHTLATARAAIQSAIKDTGGKKETLIDYLINVVYLSEITLVGGPERPLFWMLDQTVNRRTVAPATITNITAANPGVITTSAAHGLTTNDRISLYNITGMTELNGVIDTPSAASGTSITLTIDTSGFTAYSSGGKVYHQGVKLAAAVDSIVSAGWNGYSTSFDPITPQIQDNGKMGGEVPGTYFHYRGTTGIPRHYIHTQEFDAVGGQNDYLTWMPAADNVYLLRYWSKKIADRLEADGNVPLLPVKFHDMIVAGVVARLIESKDANLSVEDLSMWPRIYASQLQALKVFNDEWWDKAETGVGVKPYLS